MPKSVSPPGDVGARLKEIGGWRGEMLANVRRLIKEAAPDVSEDIKWRKPSNPGGVPVWEQNGLICIGEVYKDKVKITFAQGAAIADPKGLFNASLEAGTRRAIDIAEGGTLNEAAFKSLIKAAVALNRSKAVKAKGKAEKPVLLTGGNPQIAKGEGDGPVQAYIAAMPGWKQDVGQRLDALIVKAVPKVQKAVKWNSPFYGLDGQGWFVTFHLLTRYVKVTFFKGAELDPPPPGFTVKSGESRWIDLYEGEFDEAQLTKWMKQAAKLPGWKA
ncbi:MAG: DUF1801 domain-containing protein [Hyphomonas sp.]